MLRVFQPSCWITRDEAAALLVPCSMFLILDRLPEQDARMPRPAAVTPRASDRHRDRERDDARWQALMRRAQDGDSVAYRELLDDLYGVVTAYVQRMVGAVPLVEDCVQECLEALHRHRASYDSSRSFRAWLFAIVRHKAIDFLRRDELRRERVRAAGVEAETIGGSSAHSPTGGLLDAERLLDRLDPVYRDAVVWTKLEGCSIGEAAARAGISGVAMRTRVHRGLRRLERILRAES